jgi:hypothetical protein
MSPTALQSLFPGSKLINIALRGSLRADRSLNSTPVAQSQIFSEGHWYRDRIYHVAMALDLRELLRLVKKARIVEAATHQQTQEILRASF